MHPPCHDGGEPFPPGPDRSKAIVGKGKRNRGAGFCQPTYDVVQHTLARDGTIHLHPRRNGFLLASRRGTLPPRREPVTLRAIRGAVQAVGDSADGIEAATKELLLAMVEHNGVDPATVVAIWFTQTRDLTAAHAPAAARALGWSHVPLLGAQEAAVDGLAHVVRALMLAPLDDGVEPQHVYLGAARALRPDLEECS